MRELSLRETQEKTLSLLKEFDNICKSLDISYFLVWGTLIGAIRHKGFIPWDDDLDVAMFPDDFEKLSAYFDSYESGLELHNMKTQPDCFFTISRVCDKKHRLVFDHKKYTSGLFIDIYVMYGLGNEEDRVYWDKRFKKYPKWQKAVYACVSTTLFMGSDRLHGILNLPFVLFSKVMGKRYYVNKFNRFKKFDIRDSTYLGMPQWETVRFSKKDFDNAVYLPFEGFMAPVPEGYDHFLRSYYGDYMKLPPENARKPQHGYTAYEL